MNTLYKLLDRLESVVMDGIPIPFLPYSLVNQEKLIVLLDKIQTAIPEEIQKADQVLHQRDEIGLESQRRAQQMLQEARMQAEAMLGESELLKAVQLEVERVRQQVTAELDALRQHTLEEVEAVRNQAFDEARQVRESADEYADTVLKTLGKNLDEFQGIAKNAQKQLHRVRTDAQQAMAAPGTAIASSSMSQNNSQQRSKNLPPALNRPESMTMGEFERV